MAEIRKSRKIIIAAAVIAVVFLSVCVIFTPACSFVDEPTSTEADTGSMLYPDSSLTVMTERGDRLFSAGGEEGILPVFDAGKAGELTVRCSLPDADVTLLFYRTDDIGETVRRKLSFEDGVSVVTTDGMAGEYSVSILVETEAGATLYASCGRAVGDACGADVVMIADTRMTGELSITEPFTWDLNGFSFTTDGDIVFSSVEAGVMTIKNGGDSSLDCGRVLCDAPEWDFFIDSPFGGFLEERPFYVYASSVNGRDIDCGEIYIDSADDWDAVFRGGDIEIRPYVDRAVCEGTFTVGGAEVNAPLSFSFSGNINIDGELLLRTRAASEIKIDCSGNESSLAEKIRLDAPLCGVEWTGGDPEFSFVERYMNVKTYNGEITDPHMGGVGSETIVSGVMKSGNKTVEFVPDGNVIDLELGYNDGVDPYSAEFEFVLSGTGEGAVRYEDGGYYCVVTDGNGSERGYRINFYKSGYKLPIVYITTDGGTKITSKDEYIGGSFSLHYNGAYEYEDIVGARMGIKGRGNSSWKLDKKPYKIKFESGTGLFGLHNAKRWVLVANHVDRSLIRNRLAYSIGTVLDHLVFVPGAYPVDLFLNGEYIGVYQLSEQVEVNGGRVPGEEDSAEVDTDYFLEIGGDVTKTGFGYANFTHDLFKYVEIKNPGPETLTKEQFDFISGYVKSVEDAIKSGGDYDSLLDVDSLIDWFLLYEFSYNIDGIFRRSDFLLKEKGGKLYFCTPWDFDYGFGNMSLDSSKFAEWICLGNSKTDDYDEYIKTNIMDYLLKDEAFIARLKSRWEEIGGKMLSVGLMTVEEARENITPSAIENFRRWEILGEKIQYENRATVKIKSYEGQLDYLRDFMNKRYQWMDKTIKKM